MRNVATRKRIPRTGARMSMAFRRCAPEDATCALDASSLVVSLARQ